MVTECAHQKDVLSTEARTKIALPLPPMPSTQHSPPSTPATATKPPPVFSEASTPELFKFMDATDTLRPMATRTCTPTPLTYLERAHARQGLETWRARICREFETNSCIPKQNVLPDTVINSLLDKRAHFTTSESISQFLKNKVDWYICQKYWCLEIFDILFPVEDPIITTQLYQATLKTARAQVRKTLVAWRAKTFKAGHKRARKEFGHNVTVQSLLSDAELVIFEERFTSLDGPYSVYPVTAWTPWDGLEHQTQVWDLLRPIIIHSKLSSTAARADMTVQENRSGTEVTKEQAVKSLRVWRCRTYRSDFRTQDNIFNVEEVMPNSVINQLADQRAKIKAASMIPSMVQWEPQQQRYLQEVFDILS
ncbi:hypothetical protein BGZ81_011528 [Podila clonocystis]|nr:hypothetical protein BGZ81_011528 [Podila clonocystis]